MKRRTWLQQIGATLALLPFARLRAWQRPALFSANDIAALNGIAEVVLPTALTAQDRADVVQKFIDWHTNYKAGADMGHTYGGSVLRPASGPAVATRYAPQFIALDQAARAKGASAFASAPLATRRSVVEAALTTPQPVNRLPARPTGANLIADVAGLYFNSGAAFDLAYNTFIGRDLCRGLAGSDQPPMPLGRG